MTSSRWHRAELPNRIRRPEKGNLNRDSSKGDLLVIFHGVLMVIYGDLMVIYGVLMVI